MRETSGRWRGYSLVELMAVIAIVGVLASFAAYGISQAQMRSRDARRRIDLTKIAQAVELYYAQNKNYPLCSGQTLGDGSNGSCDAASLNISVTGGVPTDPKTKAQYHYSDQGDGAKFTLSAQPENPNANASDYTITGP